MSRVSEKEKNVRYEKGMLFKKIALFNEKYLHFSAISFKRKLFTLFSIVLFCVLIDVYTKYYMETNLIQAIDSQNLFNLPLEENQRLLQYENAGKEEFLLSTEKVIVPNFWSFEYIRNYNIGFSALLFLEKHFSKDGLKVFFISLQLTAIVLFIIVFFVNKCRYLLPTALIVSGGLGNIIDRASRGYVVDFVKWYWAESPFQILNPWPIFNMADVFVSTGVSLLLWATIFSDFKRNHISK